MSISIGTPVNPSSVFNVLSYGVKMDGVTDDYAALQALVTGPGAVAGAVIYFPPSMRSLLLSSSVYPQSNQIWWAHPGSVTLAPTAGNTAGQLLWSSANTSNVRLYGLTFDGGGQDFANGNPVSQAFHVNGLILDRCTFQNTRGLTFNGSGVNDLVVRGCVFNNCGNHWKTTGSYNDALVALSNTNGDNTTWGFRTRVEDCRFIDCCDVINLGAIQDVQVIGNTFLYTGAPIWTITTGWVAFFAAVFPLFCTSVVISNNLMLNMSGNAIDAPAVFEGVFSNNIILNSGSAGIGIFDGSGYSAYGAARGSRNVTITGNVIENSGQWLSSSFRDGITIAMSVVAASNIRITNSVITDTQTTKTQQHGVSYVGPAWSGIWVDPSNQMSGNAVGALSGLPLAGLAMDDSGNLSTSQGVLFASDTVTASGTLIAYDAQVGFNGAGQVSFRVDGTANSWRTMHWQSAGLDRWQMPVTGSGESGSNTGSDFGLYALADNGTTNVLAGAALGITRATGAVTLGAGLGVFGHAPPASRPAMTGAKGGNTALASVIALLAAYGFGTDSTT